MNNIQNKFERQFGYTGTISIAGGEISVAGDVWVKPFVKTMKKLPVVFGKVGGYFKCDNVGLISLEGAPRTVGQDFFCGNNEIATFHGAPQTVGAGFWCGNNENSLASLDGLPGRINGIFQMTIAHNTPLLKLCMIEGVVEFILSSGRKRFPQIEGIMQKYSGRRRVGALQCAICLIKAGYKDNARW